MASSSSSFSTAGNPASAPGRLGVDGGAIDVSARGPLVIFALSGMAWLLVGTVFGLIASFKLHAPTFFGDVEALTYGRVRGVESAALVYGWGFNAAFAMALWLLARLSSAVIGKPLLLSISALFWNLGVAIGVIGILVGHGTSLDGLELPGYTGPILFGSNLFIGMWGILTFRAGTSKHVYISQWYVLAALLWFPWMFSVTQIMLFIDPARGTVQTLVHAWYTHGISALWFAPIGVAGIYYLLPKLLMRPISNYYLSVYGFWTLALFGGWAGTAALIGGPVPAWVVSAGIAASLLLVVPVVVFAVNFVPTMIAAAGSLRRDWSFRFVAVGAISLLLGSVVTLLFSLRGVAEITQFSLLQNGQAQLLSYGFFSMVAFGALYYILPRVLGRPWHLPSLIGFHFWASLIGCLTSVVVLGIGGYEQALALNAVSGGAEAVPVSLLEIGRGLQPYFFVQTFALFVLVGGHLAFAVNLLWLVLGGFAPEGETSSTAVRTPLEAAAR
ncbi:MAG: cbb3-type cytochrome c oxidase subunit I [Opitutaceae bacterium]